MSIIRFDLATVTAAAEVTADGRAVVVLTILTPGLAVQATISPEAGFRLAPELVTEAAEARLSADARAEAARRGEP